MIDVVFISDLHLCPEEQEIQKRFNQFIQWAQTSVKQVYILGDFFNAWVGDDAIDDWSTEIARQLYSLKARGIPVYYMHGNRDFLLGARYAKLAGWQVLTEPTFIELGEEKIMLAHGDSYCTDDLSHQRFRRLTRNSLFAAVFLRLNLNYRKQLVNKIRERSLMNTSKSMAQMDVVAATVISHMLKNKCPVLIHGHTHKPGLTTYEHEAHSLKRYVLSDWDDNPQLLCYDISKGLYFTHI
ncbi:MAG: UDP-2,3-diacylglucosamine diphosphatase [Legionellales bacterium]